eukprot:GGOE01036788.1.p2 GENE.GGOE01036788.1~~GGOE01036788.1.p2  ORF type:complete len:164 (+),score=43.30 GGOE01036788.1:26-517(+)
MTYVPPINFGYVEAQIFRSGQPEERNFPFIETLRLHTVIFLSPDLPSHAFQDFLQEHAIRLEHLVPADSAERSSEMVTEGTVVAALRILLDPGWYPVLVCCSVGRHRTGTVMGCLRKLQNWNLTSILAEYRRFAGNKHRLENEQFIELFDTELISIPPNATIL